MFKLDFADVRPSLTNWLIIGLMAVTFITAAKFAVAHWDNAFTKPFKETILAV